MVIPYLIEKIEKKKVTSVVTGDSFMSMLITKNNYIVEKRYYFLLKVREIFF